MKQCTRGMKLCALAVVALLCAIGLGALFPSTVKGRPGDEGGTSAGTTSRLAHVVPADTMMFFEGADIHAFGSTVRTLHWVDGSKIDGSVITKTIQDAIAQAFEVSPEDAAQIFNSFSSAAAAGRSPKLSGTMKEGGDDFEGAVLYRFSDPAAGAKLIASKRFTKGEAIGSAGAFYSVKRKGDLPDGPAEALGEFEADATSNYERFAWFPASGVAAFGHPDYIKAVGATIEGAASLVTSPAYTAFTRKAPAGTLAMGFVDTSKLGEIPDFGKYLAQVFGSPEPLSFFHSHNNGVMKTSFNMPLKGEFIPPKELWAEKTELKLAARLPASTVAAMSFSGKMSVDGAKYMELYIQYLQRIANFIRKSAPPQEEGGFSMEGMIADSIEEGIRQMGTVEGAMGFKLSDLYDAVGDEAVIGWVTPGDIAAMFKSPDTIMQQTAVVMLAHVGSKDALDKVLGGAKAALTQQMQAMGMEQKFEEITGGWKTNIMGMGDLRVQYIDNNQHLLVSFGGQKAVDSAIAAFGGTEKTLGQDPAFVKAKSNVASVNHGHIWFDTGRFLDGAIKEMKDSDKEEMKKAVGFGPEVVRVTGDERVTMMIGMGVDVQGDGTATLSFEATNFFIGIAGMAMPAMASAEEVEAVPLMPKEE